MDDPICTQGDEAPPAVVTNVDPERSMGIVDFHDSFVQTYERIGGFGRSAPSVLQQNLGFYL